MNRVQHGAAGSVLFSRNSGAAASFMIVLIRTDRWLLGMILFGLVMYMAWTAYVVVADKPLDYYEYVMAAHAFSQGENIYNISGDRYEEIAQELGITNYGPAYLYPILTALCVYPLTWLPLRVGAAVWVALSGFAALLSGLILCTFTNVRWKQRVILAATLSFVPILTSMYAGQVNLFVLFATVLALYYLRRGRDFSSGLMLSASIWLKPFAIALVPLVLWRRKWKSIGGFVAGSAAINVASLILFGIAPTLSQFATVINVGTPAGLRVIPQVQNLNALVGRLTVDLPASIGFLVYLSAVGALVGISALVIASNRCREQLDLESALLVATTLLIAPLTWYHHLAMLTLVLGTVVLYWNDRFTWNSAALVLVTGFLIADLHGFIWRQLTDLHPALANFPTLMAILLWALTLTRIRHNQIEQPI